MSAHQPRMSRVRPWLPMTSGLLSTAIIAAMVWVALLTPAARLPAPPVGPVPDAPSTALDGLHLCHESAVALEACWSATAPRVRPSQAAAPVTQIAGMARRIRVVWVTPGEARPTHIERLHVTGTTGSRRANVRERAAPACSDDAVAEGERAGGGGNGGGPSMPPRMRTSS